MNFTKEQVIQIYNAYKDYKIEICKSQQDYLEFEEFLQQIIIQNTKQVDLK